ncbi:MAG: AI-2E family transporter [Pseudomonadota bacterium]
MAERDSTVPADDPGPAAPVADVPVPGAAPGTTLVLQAVPQLTTALLAGAAALWLVVELRPVLQPLVLSILVWFLLSAVARLVARSARGQGAEPGRLAFLVSGALFAAGMTVVSALLSDSVSKLRANLPAYQENLKGMVQPAAETLGVSVPPLGELIRGIDTGDLALQALGSIAGSLGQVVVIVCLVFFLFAEARQFPAKLALLLGDEAHRARVGGVLDQITRMIETYLGVKCLVGLVQAVPTWLVLQVVGVDSPLVWAVFVFLLSFIPTIGSLIGIALPSLLALVQFESPTPFILTLALLAPVQLLASNWLEPRLMGDSLNLSPLAVFLSIFAGGAVWGVTGALISVPALTVATIAMAHGARTRPVAILLSRDGKLLA